MSKDIELDPARIRSAKSRAQTEIDAAKRLERAALQARAKADKLAEVWGFYVYNNEIGDEQCSALVTYNDLGLVRCRRPEGHPDDGHRR